jgi:hypothetical protein
LLLGHGYSNTAWEITGSVSTEKLLNLIVQSYTKRHPNTQLCRVGSTLHYDLQHPFALVLYLAYCVRKNKLVIAPAEVTTMNSRQLMVRVLIVSQQHRKTPDLLTFHKAKLTITIAYGSQGTYVW